MKVKNKLNATIDAIDYSECPNTLRGGFELWLQHGILPGGFLTKVLQNDLVGAFENADIINRHLMFEILRWMVENMPYGSYGSVKLFNEWKETRNG